MNVIQAMLICSLIGAVFFAVMWYFFGFWWILGFYLIALVLVILVIATARGVEYPDVEDVDPREGRDK